MTVLSTRDVAGVSLVYQGEGAANKAERDVADLDRAIS
jgi:hypothetical protein